MKKITKAIIPCAGFGTRFLPASKSVPKEMFPIVDVPALQLIVEEAVDSGITDILIITSRSKKCIEDHFDRFPELEDLLLRKNKIKEFECIKKAASLANIYYYRQPFMAGSGGAVLLGEKFVGNEPFGVIFGDDIVYNPEYPALKQLIDAHYQTGTTIMGAQTVSKNDIVKYGMVLPGQTKGRYTQMKGVIEKPKPEEVCCLLASLGRFVLTPDIFEVLKHTKAVNGEVGLTDAICTQAQTIGAYAYDFEGIRYDTGDKLGYVKATIEYALRNPEIKDGLTEYLKTFKL